MAKDNLLARPALQPQGGSPARSRRRTRGSLMILAAVLAFFAIAGGITGRAKLTSSGLSVRDAASNANGQVTLVVPQGEMREALAELLGVNVLKGLGLLFSDSEQKTGLRCAVADFRANKGVLTAQTIVFDTEPVVVTGDGTINLGTEQLALRVKGHPKEARLLRLSVPVRVNGTLTKPVGKQSDAETKLRPDFRICQDEAIEIDCGLLHGMHGHTANVAALGEEYQGDFAADHAHP